MMTLLMLALAVIALAGVCRLSLHKINRARVEVGLLQERWAVASCRGTLLPRAMTVLAARERQGGKPIASTTRLLTLNNHQYELTFADEQAKPNLTAMGANGDRAAIERFVRGLARETDLTVDLRPTLRSREVKGDMSPAYESFGQVFNCAPPRQIQAVSVGFTCWGDHRLNWRRASPAALAAVCGKVVDPRALKAIVSAQSLDAMMSLEKALAPLQLSQKKRETLDALLSDGSVCHSLWIVPLDKPGAASFAVRDVDPLEGFRTIHFDW